MSNQLYKTTVEQLESVLAPRVVSRSLQEGLRQVGRSPDTVDYETLEQILKAQIYRQLQITLPVVEAKNAIASMLDTLREVAAAPAQPDDELGQDSLEQQGERLRALMEALKPFNIYFEWPEVQKLRAQVQLLESEQEAGREALSLVSDANSQLQIVEQKLEDLLVIQARELGELQEALEVVRTLGGSKVRRLENLINHIREAQEGRQLAPAEVERARRLGRDLRKLMESSVYSEEPAAPQLSDALLLDEDEIPDGALDVDAEEEELLTIDTAALAPEVTARLLLLDLEGERQDVEALLADHAVLLEHQPDLREALVALLPRIAADESVVDEIAAIRVAIAESFTALRETLRSELNSVSEALDQLRPDVDTAELRQGLRVALGILTTTLPSLADVTHLRQLQQLALERAEAFERSEAETSAQYQAQLQDQAMILERLESTLLRYEGSTAAEQEYVRLREELGRLREAHARQTLVPGVIDEVRRAEESLESAMAVLADDRVDRQRASLRNLLVRVKSLPALDTVAARIASIVAEIERQLAHLETGAIDDAQVRTIDGLVSGLQADARASARRKLDGLAAQAAEIDSAAVLERIQTAVENLETNTYPDLHALRSALDQARDSQRSEQVDELHKLEGRAARYAGSESPAHAQLIERLTEARERIRQGALAPRLQPAWELLDRVEAETTARLGSVMPRLDAALTRLALVEKLNSDDVATVRRILTHLDGQREAFEKVSVSLRLQLEASLREAETLLVKLQDEYEATRVIADQLVSANVLDDVFGFLDGAEPDAPTLVALLEAFSSEAEVAATAVLDGQGAVVMGDLPDDLASELLVAIRGLRAAATTVVQGLDGDDLRVLTLDFDGGALLIAWPTDDHCVVITLRSAADLALLGNRLRRDLTAFARALAAEVDATPRS